LGDPDGEKAVFLKKTIPLGSAGIITLADIIKELS
jgi:hypothetical protein